MARIRLRYNGQRGTTGASLTSSGTTITFTVAPNFATIVSPTYIPLTLEPNTANMEIVYLTAYTSGATTGTITRAAEDATLHPAVAHVITSTWDHGPTKGDFDPQDSLQSPAFAASLTIDASAGDTVVVGALTANITAVNAPTNPTTGQRLTILFLQDGTGGRTVAGWNAVFKQAWADTGNTLNKRSSISFVYDGTNWIQVGAQSPYL